MYKLNKLLFKQKHKNYRVVVQLRYIFLLSNLVFDYNPWCSSIFCCSRAWCTKGKGFFVQLVTVEIGWSNDFFVPTNKGLHKSPLVVVFRFLAWPPGKRVSDDCFWSTWSTLGSFNNYVDKMRWVKPIHFINNVCTILIFWKKNPPHQTFPS